MLAIHVIVFLEFSSRYAHTVLKQGFIYDVFLLLVVEECAANVLYMM